MKYSKIIFNVFFLVIVVAYIAQFIIDFSLVNITSASIVFASSFITFIYLRWTRSFYTYPLSSVAIFGLCITSQLGAMIAQSLLLTSLSQDLRQPIETFSTLGLFQLIAIIAHYFYRIMAKPRADTRDSLIRHLLSKIGVYTTPSITHIWLMGCVGLFSLAMTKLGGGELFSKISSGIQFAAWLPFLIPLFAAQQGKSYCNIKLQLPFIGLFFLGVAAFSLAVNAKGTMMTGVVTIGLVFMLETFRSNTLATRTQLKKVLIFTCLGGALIFPASQVVTAMQVARYNNNVLKSTAKENLMNTIEAFGNDAWYQNYRNKLVKEQTHSEYDEHYIDSLLLSRFTETKFHDNTFYYGSRLTDESVTAVQKISADFFWVGLPEPVLDWLKIDVDKVAMQFSMGDFIFHEAIGTPLVGYRTGSGLGQGLVLFGSLFFVIYFVICIFLYFVKDIFVYKTQSGMFAISPLGLATIWPNFLYGVTSDSLHTMAIGVFRNLPTILLFYFILFNSTKLLVIIFDKSVLAKNEN